MEIADGPVPVAYDAVDRGVNAPVLAMTAYADKLLEPLFAIKLREPRDAAFYEVSS